MRGTHLAGQQQLHLCFGGDGLGGSGGFHLRLILRPMITVFMGY